MHQTTVIELQYQISIICLRVPAFIIEFKSICWPVSDVFLLPHGFPMEEVVIGHIWDTTAGLFHDFHGLDIDFSGFLQREELLHFL